MARKETYALVLGAGPSGLSTAACLSVRNIPYLLLDRAPQIAASWRNHYERLHLHTVKQHSSLPMFSWPSDVPMYPSRAQVVSYFEQYAERFRLEAECNVHIKHASFDGHYWNLRAENGDEYQSKVLVIATGYNRRPNIPHWSGEENFRGTILHSSQFREGSAWRGKRALVVGAGNSGAEIALDLWEHGASTALSIRGPIHVVPRDAFGIPAQVNSLKVFSKLPPQVADWFALRVGDVLFGDLRPYGMHRPALGPISQVVFEKKIPLIDIGTVELIKQRKILVHPGPKSFTETDVVFEDGSSHPFDLVLLATGYNAAVDEYLEHAQRYVDERGYPRFHGVEAPTPGLYFLGYRNPLTGALHDIAREAERIAADVANKRA